MFGLKRKDPLRRALKCPLRVSLNPHLPTQLRHGTVWFEVSGFGLIQRHFLVDDRDLLVNNVKSFAMKVARQIILIDPSLPKREIICQPARIDIIGTQLRRVLDLPTFRLLLEQPL